MDHLRLGDRARAPDDGGRLGEAVALGHAGLRRRLREEAQRRPRQRAARRREHRPVVHRLRRRDRRIGIAHRRRSNHAALENQARLDAEEGRLPQHQVGPLADLDRADLVRDTVRDGGVDRVLGDVALDAEVVVPAARVVRVAGQLAALRLHLVRGLPGAQDHLADAAHGLRVAREHRERAQVVQDVFGGDGFSADAALGEGDVLGDGGVQMVAHHQHIEVLVQRVDGERPRRVGRRGQHVGLAAHADDVRRMAAARPLGVIRVDGAALERGDGRLDEARFVERVGVDGDLRVGVVGHAQAAVDGGGRRAPVFVQLQADGAGIDLLAQRAGQAAVALAQETDVHRVGIGRLQHALQVPRPRRAGGRVGACGRPGAAADHGRHAAVERLVDLLRADEMDMRIDPARRDDHAFARDDLGARPDDDGHARLDVRIARLADGGNAAVLQADVGLDDAPVVDDQRVGDDRVGAVLRFALALAHAVADDLAAAEFHLFAVDRVVALDLDDKVGVGQADAVAGGRAEHLRIGAAGDLECHIGSLNLRACPSRGRQSRRPRGPRPAPPVPRCAPAPARSARRCRRRC